MHVYRCGLSIPSLHRRVCAGYAGIVSVCMHACAFATLSTCHCIACNEQRFLLNLLQTMRQSQKQQLLLLLAPLPAAPCRGTRTLLSFRCCCYRSWSCRCCCSCSFYACAREESLHASVQDFQRHRCQTANKVSQVIGFSQSVFDFLLPLLLPPPVDCFHIACLLFSFCWLCCRSHADVMSAQLLVVTLM